MCAPSALKSLLNWTVLPQSLKRVLHIRHQKYSEHFCHFSNFAHPILKILENWKTKHKFFRVKDNLAVILPYGQKFPRHNILVIIYN